MFTGEEKSEFGNGNELVELLWELSLVFVGDEVGKSLKECV